MTIATTRTRNPDIAAIIRGGYRRAGLLNEDQELSEARARVGREELDDLLDYLQTEGVPARSQTFELITLVEGQRDYTLDASTLDVRDNGAYIAPGDDVNAANAETIVCPMTIQEWQVISAKDATGIPFKYFTDRSQDVLTVRLWMIPSAGEAGGSIRFIVERLSADAMNGNATVDKERFWIECLKSGLAWSFSRSNSLNPGRIAQHKADFRELLEKCRAKAAPTVPSGFRMGHRTPWSR